MSARETSLLKAVGLFLLVIALGWVVVFQTHVLTSQKARATSEDNPFPSPTPIEENVAVLSSDGSEKLLIRKRNATEETVEYVLSVSSSTGADERELITKTLTSDWRLEIPPNAWSPDDSYVFVRLDGPTSDTYLVLKPSGELFVGGERYVDVGALWSQKKLGFTLREATGWASPTLLILYTTTANGAKGPAYWFEAPSKALIKLSH